MTEGVLGQRFWERWNKLEGKSLVARFAQADMLVEVCGVPNGDHTNDGSRALMEAIAEKTGYNVKTLSFWRLTASRVTEVRRDTSIRLGISWASLQEVATSDDWKKLLPRLLAAAEKGKPWTVTETRRQLGHSTEYREKLGERPTAREVVAGASVEEKARIAAELIKDKDVAAEIVTDHSTVVAIGTASYERGKQMKHDRAIETHGEEKVLKWTAGDFIANMMSMADGVMVAAISLSSEVTEWALNDGQKERIAKPLRQAIPRLQMVESYLSGSIDSDALLAAASEED